MTQSGEQVTRRDDIRRRLEERYRRLAESRRLSPVTALVARYNDIDGGTQGAVVSTQLFTTVIPLMIIGFSYLHGFADNASPGTIFTRQFGLEHPLSDRLREAFGNSAGLRADWTLIGVASFLVWGIPMAASVATIFGKAWRREQYRVATRLLRGTAWFALYLVTIAVRERIMFGHHHHGLPAHCCSSWDCCRCGCSGRSPRPCWCATAAGACVRWLWPAWPAW
ncbi:hypothetical protein ACQ86B_03235 [Mycolicibacterium aichiense]|uniref:hypothetical protein n=1 Tax=Mycolicibacterium aichiense TaxID=1799 RepID=UPI003D66CA99